MNYSRSALSAAAESTTSARLLLRLTATLGRLFCTAGARAASFSTKAIFAAGCALLLISSAAQGAPIAVTNGNDSLAGSLRQAIQDATPGDTIIFQIPKTDAAYNADINVFTIRLKSSLTIGKNLTIDGAGTKIAVAAATDDCSVFLIKAGTVMLSRLTIQDGNQFVAGGIVNDATLILRDCTLFNNSGESGALSNRPGATALIDNCTFAGNRGFETIYNRGTLQMTNSAVVANERVGVVNPDGAITVRNCVIAKNPESDVGGAFNSEGFNFIGNPGDATGFGGSGSRDQVGTKANPADPRLGPLQDNGGPTLTFKPLPGSPLIDQGDRGTDSNGNPNNADQRDAPRPVDQPAIANGGDGSDIGPVEVGLPQTGATLSVTTIAEGDDGVCSTDDCTFLEALNAANVSSDANEVVFAPNVVGRILNTVAPDGLDLVHTLTIRGPGARLLAIAGGPGQTRLFEVLSAARVTISGLTLTGGEAPGSSFPANSGGAITNKGTLTISDCDFAGNNAQGGGAAVFNDGANRSATLEISNSSFYANSSNGGGGAAIYSLALYGTATVNLTNCTFFQNAAFGPGGAIYNKGNVDGTATLTLTNCTIDRNSAQGSGGIFNDARNGGFRGTAAVVLRNTIFRTLPNSASLTNDSDDGGGTITSHGSNISTDTGGGFLNGPGDKPRTTDPKLGEYGYYGGPTRTVPLLEGSPAINAGNDSFAPAMDQRGFARVNVSDIGAFEFGGASPTPTPAPTVTPPPPPPPPPTPTPVPNRFANISTRVRVETGANILFGGFIVSGSQQKKIIVRAIGPSLEVEDRLANPLLELYNGNGELIASNDNWREAENAQEIIDSKVPPSNELESAILRDVELGVYTAQIRDVADGHGVALVEVYDIGAAQDSKLANIATRGRIQTGDNVMIAGLIISGSSPQKVIVRAIGPSLQDVAGRLEDPVLELYDRYGVLTAENNNWRDTQEAEIATTTIPPSNDLESAIVAFLPPDLYTAQVRGAGDTTGVGIVEVYALD